MGFGRRLSVALRWAFAFTLDRRPERVGTQLQADWPAEVLLAPRSTTATPKPTTKPPHREDPPCPITLTRRWPVAIQRHGVPESLCPPAARPPKCLARRDAPTGQKAQPRPSWRGRAVTTDAIPALRPARLVACTSTENGIAR